LKSTKVLVGDKHSLIKVIYEFLYFEELAIEVVSEHFKQLAHLLSDPMVLILQRLVLRLQVYRCHQGLVGLERRGLKVGICR
jgi:hypothetical protein